MRGGGIGSTVSATTQVSLSFLNRGRGYRLRPAARSECAISSGIRVVVDVRLATHQVRIRLVKRPAFCAREPDLERYRAVPDLLLQAANVARAAHRGVRNLWWRMLSRRIGLTLE